jgi:hypothetical protein
MTIVEINQQTSHLKLRHATLWKYEDRCATYFSVFSMGVEQNLSFSG